MPPGIEHVVSVICTPTPATLNNASGEDISSLPKVHIQTYTLKLLSSGTRIPRVELVPMGPSLDLVLRRHQPADPELLKQTMKRPKPKKADVEKGLGGRRIWKWTIWEICVGKLQTRKMKGLKAGADDMDVENDGFGSGRRSNDVYISLGN